MIDEEYVTILSNALGRLDMAWAATRADTRPEAPLFRVRRFYLAPGVVGPDSNTPSDVAMCRLYSSRHLWHIIYLTGDSRYYVAEFICERCKWQPRLMLRALRRIEAATRWCEARAAGRRQARKKRAMKPHGLADMERRAFARSGRAVAARNRAEKALEAIHE